MIYADAARTEDSRPGARIGPHVGLSLVPGPIVELEGDRLKLLRTSLTDRGNGARAAETGDGNLWIVESEPMA